MSTVASTVAAELLLEQPYRAYSYSYPHKSAYRTLAYPVDLRNAWALEDRSALFAYLHVPFCSMRCGFCNLFAMARPKAELVDAYVDALIRQMHVTAEILDTFKFARLALGGGTPSYLSAQQLDRLLSATASLLRIDPNGLPSSIEVSPETASAERLAVARAAGISRVSMGVQSFVAAELEALIRPQQSRDILSAIDAIRKLGFPILNLDLIYGVQGQSIASWLHSIETAVALEPEEVYLYPLYVRASTGLGRATSNARRAVDLRQQLYRVGRDRLLDAGYRQVSMRMFRSDRAPEESGPVYCCQDDGMVGFGAGARSYTRELHYSCAYAVDRRSTQAIVEQFVGSSRDQLKEATYGFRLDDAERKRRFAIQSLLLLPGLQHADYRRRFASEAATDLPQLRDLCALDLATDDGAQMRLTTRGLELADAIGPWLASVRVQSLMQERRTTC
jgi:oxygen-independent coproporphyrinogen III oxidase